MSNDAAQRSALPSTAKRVVQAFLRPFGIHIARIPKVPEPAGADKYFNTGALTPFEENSVALYDQFYGDSEALEAYYGEGRTAFYTELSNLLRGKGVVADGRDILDVGCGSGHLLEALQSWSRPRSLSGCDFSQASVEFSQRRLPGCEFFTHDIYQPLLGKFDVVLCTEVIEHLERPARGLRNLLDATRPGGTIVLTTPNGRLDTINEHIHFWSPESWKVFVEDECPGCTIDTTTFRNNHNNLAIVKKPKS